VESDVKNVAYTELLAIGIAPHKRNLCQYENDKGSGVKTQ